MDLVTIAQPLAYNASPILDSSWPTASVTDLMAYDGNYTYNDNETYADFNFTCDYGPPNTSEFFYHGRKETFVPINAGEIVKIIFYVIMFVISVTGNILVLLVFYHNDNMRSTINQHLVNLAVADLLVAFFCMWVHLVRHLTYPHYVLPAFVCKLDGFIQATAVTASVLTLTVISFTRLAVVMYPLEVRVSTHRACRVITCVWILSAVLSSPFAIFRELYSLKWLDFKSWHCDEIWPKELIRDKTGRCVPKVDIQKIFYALFTTILFFLPVVVMFINYSLVGWRLCRSQLPGEHNPWSHLTSERRRQKGIKMVFVVLIAFVICWTPLQSIILYGHLFKNGVSLSANFEAFEYAAYFMAHSNSALNPIIYCGFNDKFRQGVLALFCRRRVNGRLHTRRPWTPSWMGGTTRESVLGQDDTLHRSASRNNRWSTKLSHMYSFVSRNLRSVPQLQQQQQQQLSQNDSHCRKASSSSQQSLGCGHYHQNYSTHYPLHALNSTSPATPLRNATSYSNQPEFLPPVPDPVPQLEEPLGTPEPLRGPRTLAAAEHQPGALKRYRVTGLGEPCGCCGGDSVEGGGGRERERRQKKKKKKRVEEDERATQWSRQRSTSCNSIELGTCGTYTPVREVPGLFGSRAEAVC